VADDALVIFTPSGRRGRFPEGTTVLDAARSLGVDIDSVCGGRGICGRCQVTQGLGEFAKHGITSRPENLSAFAALEAAYRDEKGLAADRRLSCTAQVCGDVLIDVPPESQVHRQVVRKGLDVRTFIVDPVVRLHYVEVTPPELASPTGDLARLFEALEREWQLTGLDADLQVIRALQPALEAGALLSADAGEREAYLVDGQREALGELVAVDVKPLRRHVEVDPTLAIGYREA